MPFDALFQDALTNRRSFLKQWGAGLVAVGGFRGLSSPLLAARASEPIRKAAIQALLRSQIEQVWGAGDLAAIERNYNRAVIDHMAIAGQTKGLDGLKSVVAQFRTAMPDLTMRLHGVIACGDIGVDFWTLEGTQTGPLFGQPPSKRRVKFSGIDMVRVHSGKIVQLWHIEEMLQFFSQIDGNAPALSVPATMDWDRPTTKPNPAILTARERRNLSIAQEHIEEIWAKGDAKAAYRLYAPDVIDHNPAPNQRSGITGIVDVLGWLRQSVPDLRMSIRQLVVDGNLAADRWVMRGTHSGAPLMGIAATGKTFEINGMDVIRIRDDGLISDVWHAEEFSSLASQIRT